MDMVPFVSGNAGYVQVFLTPDFRTGGRAKNMNNASDEGIQLCKSGKFAESIEKLKEHLRFEPTDINAHNYLGIAYAQTRRYEEAISEFLALTRLEPGNATHCYNLGLAYEANGNDLQAGGAYQKALQLRPDYQKAKDSLSALTAKQQRIDATQIAAAPAHYQSNEQAYQAQPPQPPYQQPQGQGYQPIPPQQPAYQAPKGQSILRKPIPYSGLIGLASFILIILLIAGQKANNVVPSGNDAAAQSTPAPGEAPPTLSDSELKAGLETVVQESLNSMNASLISSAVTAVENRTDYDYVGIILYRAPGIDYGGSDRGALLGYLHVKEGGVSDWIFSAELTRDIMNHKYDE